MAGKKKQIENERTDIVIDNGVATWSIKYDGPINGTYLGQFKFRCYLSPTQRIAAGRDYRSLLGSNPTLAPEHESFLAYALTQLKYRIIESPPFWTSAVTDGVEGDLPDEEVLTTVLDAAIAAEVKFKKEAQKRKLDAIERAKEAAERMLSAQKEDKNAEDQGEEISD